MKRWLSLSVTLAFLAGCSGAGGVGSGGSGFVPGMGANGGMHGGPPVIGDRHHRMIRVKVRMRIPRRHRHEHLAVHPSTISPLTQSVSIGINTLTPVVFNATPSSPNCTFSAGATTCTFTVAAPLGNDTFTVTTYSAINGGGTALDQGIASVSITKGQANTVRLNLGPVVSSNADSGPGSLRYAVGSANPGDTILFMVASGTTVTLNTPITISNNVNIAGPGFSAHGPRRFGGKHSSVTYTGVTLSGNNANQIFVLNAGATSTISGLILTQGKATVANQPGGAVYNAGTLTLSDDAIVNNTSIVSSPYARVRAHAEHPRHRHRGPQAIAPDRLRPHSCSTTYYYGGGVYNHGSLSISDSTFDSNVLTNNFFPSGTNCQYSYGGAIYNDEYGTMSSEGDTYENNSAYAGGAIYNDGYYGQVTIDNGGFDANHGCNDVTGCAPAGCTGNGCTAYGYGYGGAIYDAGGPGVVITNSTFRNNVVGGALQNSAGEGGALYLETGTPSITNSTFDTNLAGGGVSNCSWGEGGAIFENASGPIELDSDTFTSNKAGGDWYAYGGAVYNDNDNDHGSNNVFTGNTAAAPGTAACSHHGYAYAGAVYADYGMSMSSTSFTSNTASASYEADAGAVYVDDPSTLTSDTFSSNTASVSGLNGATSAYTYGGALEVENTTRMTGCTFTSNSATDLGTVANDAEGGAIYVDSTLVSNGNTFNTNSATIATGTGATVYGGGVSAQSSSTLISNGDKFTSNAGTSVKDVYGGGLYADGTWSVANATFTSNVASGTGSDSYGGGVYMGSSGTLTNSTVSGNTAGSGTAGGYGGGIDDSGGSTLNGVTIANNVATDRGGGVYAAYSSGTTNFNNSTVSGNSVSTTDTYSGGGGIYAYYAVQMVNSTVSGNTVALGAGAAENGGGGIYMDYPLTLIASTVSGNSVTGAVAGNNGGGGIYDYYYAAEIDNSTINGNSSSQDGGGFLSYAANSAMNLNNDTLYQNTATGNGGNMLNNTSGSPYLTLTNTIVAGGTAGGTGADVDNPGTLTSGDYNIFGTAVAGGGTFTPAAHDQQSVNPALLALSSNGGPTKTNADTASSPGMNAIPYSGGKCGAFTTAVDQRGFTRGGNGHCDVGSYEFNGVATSIKQRVPKLEIPRTHRDPGSHLRPVRHH